MTAWQDKPTWRAALEAVLYAVLLATFVRTYLIQVYTIPTSSMEPNLEIGDRVLVNKFIFASVPEGAVEKWLPARRPRFGDVAVFRYPPDPRRDFIKRCIGLPGNTVEIVDKQLRLDGRELEEPYTQHVDERVYPRSLFLPDGYRKRDNFGPIVVPRGQAFVLGDNRDYSNDSRFWGPVADAQLRGRALFVLWSYGEAAEDGGKEGAAGWRWRRTLRPVR